MSKLMVSVSGVRGIFGESLTPGIALNFATHFGIFQKRGKIVVGRDSRTTGIAMFNAVVSGLLSVGCDVIDLGIVSTPTVLLAVEQSDAAGGISITASHNPSEWNAMKFVGSSGMFLFPEEADRFISSLDEPVAYAKWDEIGQIISDPEGTKRHIDKILTIPYLDIEKIRAKKFKVVIDCVNGAGGVISPTLLRELGCEVIELNCETTGYFAHTPEPLKKNLGQLEAAVKQNGADVGFANDPDVDRLAIVSEKGECIGEELSLLLAEKFVLTKKKGPIVTNLSSSMASEDIAKSFDERSPYFMESGISETTLDEIRINKTCK
jgi:phosphomannomutase